MKLSSLHITLILIFMIVLPASSCGKTPDTETISVFVRASNLYSQGRFGEVSEILRTQNKFPPALMLRAKAEYFSGDIETAEQTCKRAVKLHPSLFEAYLYLARILREKGDLNGAAKIIESLLADNPQDIRALRLAADIAAEEGKIDKAAIFLDRAAEFSAESAMVLLDRARLRWIAGRNNDALEDLKRAKAMLPWETPLLRSISNLENIITEVR